MSLSRDPWAPIQLLFMALLFRASLFLLHNGTLRAARRLNEMSGQSGAFVCAGDSGVQICMLAN